MGSSPLTRGKRLFRPKARTNPRLIPAHAGKTQAKCSSLNLVRAHPRSRGENLRVGRSDSVCWGLIPAHAGKTPTGRQSTGEPGAHPRSRGENISSRDRGTSSKGSSPLTRGKRRTLRGHQPGPRLIPAHAGKTYSAELYTFVTRAHPRSRGENTRRHHAVVQEAGSSPLTRGKLPDVDSLGPHLGLIPAHAGKTACCSVAWTRRRAHPRSRGENLVRPGRRPAHAGSSPLTRGKHFLTCAFIAQIDQILESLELCAFSESYSSQDVYATDAPRDRVRSIGLAPRSSRGAS